VVDNSVVDNSVVDKGCDIDNGVDALYFLKFEEN
jgi:hypothetical protein